MSYKPLVYPSYREIARAYDYDILRWYRNLPSPRTDKERAKMDRIAIAYRAVLDRPDFDEISREV